MCLLSRRTFEVFRYGLGAWLVAFGHVDICNFERGHGWLLISLEEIILIGILQQISQRAKPSQPC